MSFFRQNVQSQNNQGVAISGAQWYVCTQPVSTVLSPIIAIPPAPLANLFAASSSNATTITNAVWSGGFITFTFASVPSDVVAGSYFALTGVTPAAYNAIWLIAIVSGNSVTVASASNPGTYVSGGTVATSALPNPFPTDGNGNGFFYALTATYTLVEHDPFGRIPDTFFADQVVLAPGGGSVTSVGLALPATVFTVSNSPVSSTGTLTGTLITQNANSVWAGPTSGPAATPTFRALVAADISGVGTGSVTSVALAVTVPSWLTSVISGSPVTSSGTLTATISANTETANTLLAGPASGSAAAPTFRTLVVADLPSGTSNSVLASNGSAPTYSTNPTVTSLTTTGLAKVGTHLNSTSPDVAGTATINLGSPPVTSVAVTYSAAFTGSSAPVVVVIAKGADPSALGGVWVTNQGTSGNWTGFTINTTNPPASSATFNYVVIGS